MQTSLLLCENELDFLDVGAGILGGPTPPTNNGMKKYWLKLERF